MAYRLPPLNSLRLFEAAGRHLSFKEAAAELHLTPSAVSHGVQSLEDWLGVALFHRGNRSLALTEAGLAYLPQIRTALDHLAQASINLPGREIGGKLAISVAPSFGLRWLIPRLPRFTSRHPTLEVMLDTAHRPVAFPREGVDLAIRMGRGDWRGLHAVCLAMEELVPVCAPSLAPAIQAYDDLAALPLLQVMDVSEDWQSWCDLAALPPVETSRALRFDTIHMAMEAAAQGLGVAIGRLPLIAADLAAGRLVAVLGPARPCATGYWLVTAPEAAKRPEIRAFRRWIEEELGQVQG